MKHSTNNFYKKKTHRGLLFSKLTLLGRSGSVSLSLDSYVCLRLSPFKQSSSRLLFLTKSSTKPPPPSVSSETRSFGPSASFFRPSCASLSPTFPADSGGFLWLARDSNMAVFDLKLSRKFSGAIEYVFSVFSLSVLVGLEGSSSKPSDATSLVFTSFVLSDSLLFLRVDDLGGCGRTG